MGPDNVLMGDSQAFDLPQPVEVDGLVEEKKIAKYSKSDEFKVIQDHCRDRIAFYQSFLPNGAEIGMDVIPTPEDWRVANRIIGEFKLLMNLYETTTEAVDEQRV
jgi:hypothetical protein